MGENCSLAATEDKMEEVDKCTWYVKAAFPDHPDLHRALDGGKCKAVREFLLLAIFSPEAVEGVLGQVDTKETHRSGRTVIKDADAYQLCLDETRFLMGLFMECEKSCHGSQDIVRQLRKLLLRQGLS
jgi:hypothetical protein